MDVNSLYILASRVQGHSKRLEMIADNVANANTTGFKKMAVDFAENAAKKDGIEVGSFARDSGPRVVHTQGTAVATGNPLDAFLQGDGFFGVSVNGETHFTRDGRFTMNGAGQLINSSGHLVLDANQAPINIPPDAQQIVITPEGTISTDQGPIANIGVFEFSAEERQQDLMRVGSNVYALVGDALPQPATNTTVAQGMIEGSNVNPIEETVHMTEVSQAYQRSLRMIQQIEQLDQRSIRDLARQPQ